MNKKKTIQKSNPARRVLRKVFSKNNRIRSYINERNNLIHDKGVLQLEKGQLEAKVRELQDHLINPKGAHPPSNPIGYIPKHVKKNGQVYRQYLTRQIYSGTTSPKIPGFPANHKSLQIGLGREGNDKFGPNWVVVDLFDPSPLVDYNFDVQDLPANWSNRYDMVLCNAVLEHIPYPQKAIDELHRVIKPGGYVYVELPFWQQYHTGGDSTLGEQYDLGGDFWRATVEGLRIWMHEFDEISCGWGNEGVVYFFGRKPRGKKHKK